MPDHCPITASPLEARAGPTAGCTGATEMYESSIFILVYIVVDSPCVISIVIELWQLELRVLIVIELILKQ